jgi:sec-independent protein translocase protein TatC
MPTDKDLFNEEQQMVAMSFGDHIEELRARLILGLLGLMVGVLVVFIPPLNLGKRIMTKMEEPAKGALTRFYNQQAIERARQAEADKAVAPTVHAKIPADVFVAQLRSIAPDLKLPAPETLEDQFVSLPLDMEESGAIRLVDKVVRPSTSLITLAPLEAMTIFFMVCVIAGLVLSSPWVFYQAWAFVAAGLYRHERHYVMRYLPFSLGLFLTGVLSCFFFVLPITLSFLLEFNVWLGLEPTLRLTDWMSFATILPLVFGVCFQTPLVMLLLERIGILTVEDYRSKRKMAILVIVIAGAVLTPGQDPFSQVLLAGPMILLYELGILLVSHGRKPALAGVGE